MKKTFKAYANYGVTGNEYKTIFTVENAHCYSKRSEEIEINVPEGFSVSENSFGETLIDTPDGTTYLAQEILNSRGDEPVLEWNDEKKQHRAKCQWTVNVGS